MRSLFFITTAMALSLVALPAQASECWKCEAAHAAVARGTVAYSDALTCIYLEQEDTRATPLFIYDGAGKLLNADPTNPNMPRKPHDQVKAKSDSYCVGRHFVEDAKATGGWIILCNWDRVDGKGWTSNRIEGAVLDDYLKAGEAPQTLATTVCLMDGPACDKRLADRHVPE